ncbi:MAG: type II toxin-antitoxin system HicA family toxin [Caldilineaceae bacterium]|nr:type II toxin-antitoxin system HicA family toxin [Caldilineaceae bacterium]
MPSFPSDAPKADVLRALERLGFQIVCEGNHIALARVNKDGSKTPITLPNHRRIKGSTLRNALRQAQLSRDEFLSAYFGD